MATLFGSPPFLSNPPTRTHHLSSPSPNFPASQLPQSPTQKQQLSLTSDEQKLVVTRRFGLGVGFAWAGFLAFGAISEQIKTRHDVSIQGEAFTRDVGKQEEIVLPNGIRYTELGVGSGAYPRTGDLVVFNVMGQVEGSREIFVNTFGGEMKSLALVMGSRPYSKGICEGIENVLRSMKAGGTKRVIVPAILGFGDKGADFGSDMRIPPSATLEYVVQVDSISIPA
ncbi:hypothetical protein ACFE04_005644 [Oxalis oulophora]